MIYIEVGESQLPKHISAGNLIRHTLHLNEMYKEEQQSVELIYTVFKAIIRKIYYPHRRIFRCILANLIFGLKSFDMILYNVCV